MPSVYDGCPSTREMPSVLIAILVRDKEATLPLFLKCLDLQSYPRSRIGIYIRENDSTDSSAEILKAWTAKCRSAPACEQYIEIHENYDPVPGAASDCSSEWTVSRFVKLAKIRRESVMHAYVHHYSAYFVIDADNFIHRDTVASLMAVRHLGVVAPFLPLPNRLYANYHLHADENGYFLGGPGNQAIQDLYDIVRDQKIRGLIECQVVHCTYMVPREFYHAAIYDDGTCVHEYVIFSRNLRRLNIPQYLDTRKVWGSLTMTRGALDLPHKLELLRPLEALQDDGATLTPEAADLHGWLHPAAPVGAQPEPAGLRPKSVVPDP